MKKYIFTLCVMAAISALSGCASQLQALSAANTSAVVSVRAAADLQAKINAEAFCTLSVDTLARNTQYLQGVKSLCWSGQVATPADTATSALTAMPAPTANTATLPAVVAPAAPVVAAPVVLQAPAPAPAPAVKRVYKPAPAVVVPSPVVVAPVVAPAPVAAPMVVPAPAVAPVPTSLLSTPVIPK